MTAAPESRATLPSMPVPTNGASARTNGTACRCMFEPMSARLASSFSKNGMSAAATETSCFGDTSMKSMHPRRTQRVRPPYGRHQIVGKAAFCVSSALAWAIVYLPSSIADM